MRLIGCSAMQALKYQPTELLLHVDPVSTRVSPESSEKSSNSNDDAPSDRELPRKKAKIDWFVIHDA
jgi:hypothetical protein